MEKEYLHKSTYLFTYNECAIGGQFKDLDIIKSEVKKINPNFYKALNTHFKQAELVYIPDSKIWYVQVLAKNPRINIACFFTSTLLQNEHGKAIDDLISGIERNKQR